MTLKQLEYFLALSQNCHFSNTAAELFVSQSTLSHSVAELEEELGVKLFERSGNAVSLTVFGEKYAAMVQPIITSLTHSNNYLREMSRERVSRVHVGVFPSLYSDFSRLALQAFNRACPDNQINLVFYDRKRTFDLLNEVETGIIDMSYTTISKPGLRSKLVFRQRYYLYVPESHPLAGRASVTFDDIKFEKYVVIAQHMASRPYIDSIFDSRGVEMNIVSEQINNFFVVNYVSNGYGVTLMPYSRCYNVDGTRAIPVADPAFCRDIYLVWRTEEALSPDAITIKNFLLEHSEEIYQDSLG